MKKIPKKKKPPKRKPLKTGEDIPYSDFENPIITVVDKDTHIGAPSKQIDLNVVKILSSLDCTQTEMYTHFNMSGATWARAKKNNPVIDVMIIQGKQQGKIAIRRKLMEEARNGNTAILLFLAKNRLGMDELSNYQVLQVERHDRQVKDEILGVMPIEQLEKIYESTAERIAIEDIKE